MAVQTLRNPSPGSPRRPSPHCWAASELTIELAPPKPRDGTYSPDYLFERLRDAVVVASGGILGRFSR